MEIVLIFLALFAFLLAGVPVFLSLATLGIAILLLTGQSLSGIGPSMFNALNSFVLLAIPLFTLMSQIMLKAGVGDDLFDFVHTWLGSFRGGLAITTIVTCALFGAICGSSAAAALTIGSIAIPALIRHNYKKEFASGLVGAGGTLAIMIPPSGPAIIYGALTDTSVAKLFIAGIVPGVLISLIFAVYAWLYCVKNPELKGISTTWKAKWSALKKVAFPLTLPPIITGGIYTGAFTPTEAAAVGASLSFVIVFLIQRRLWLRDIYEIMKDTAKTTCILMMIIACAVFFGQVLALNQIPQEMVKAIVNLKLGKWGFLILVNILLLFLGCFLEVVSIILITVPILYPAIKALGLDPIWFGVLFLLNMEIALITPPVGMNLYVLMGVAKAKIEEIVRGVRVFILLLGIALVIVMLQPEIALWLPKKAFGV